MQQNILYIIDALLKIDKKINKKILYDNNSILIIY